jgi:hypothetical protein
MKILLMTVTGLILLMGCRSAHTTDAPRPKRFRANLSFTPTYDQGPPTLVYKTRADYADYVPVRMNDTRTEVVFCPDPRDLRKPDGYNEPIALAQGYFVDNRGIDTNIAFLKLTYQDYANLTRRPTQRELAELILDKDPLLELCDCGSRTVFQNVEAALNAAITAGTLRTKCKGIK